MNKNSPEALATIELIDSKISVNRIKLESESTPIDQLPLYRAKLFALTTLRKELEEKFNAGATR